MNKRLTTSNKTELTPKKSETCQTDAGFPVPIPEKFARGARHFNLSPREVQVIVLVAEGNPWKAVADKLAISTRTVRFHLYNARHKIHGAQSTMHAVASLLF
jgi:DNA-binding CsgD family transcriptional regulator